MLYDPAPEARQTVKRWNDDLLRDYGFSIAFRPRRGEAWWTSPEGELMRESTALEEIAQRSRQAREAVREAVALEKEKSRRGK